MKAHSRDTLYFTLLLTVFMSILVLLSFGYDRETRLVPLIVGIPTLFLLAFQVLLHFKPQLQKRFEIDVFSPASLSKSKTGRQEEKGNLLFHAALIFAYFILILLLGFLIATPIYLLIFFRTYGNQTWIKGITGAAIAWGLLYLIFSMAMKFTLFEGVLFGGRL